MAKMKQKGRKISSRSKNIEYLQLLFVDGGSENLVQILCNTVCQYLLNWNIRFQIETNSHLSAYLGEMHAYALCKTCTRTIMAVLFVQIKTRYNLNAH